MIQALELHLRRRLYQVLIASSGAQEVTIQAIEIKFGRKKTVECLPLPSLYWPFLPLQSVELQWL